MTIFLIIVVSTMKSSLVTVPYQPIDYSLYNTQHLTQEGQSSTPPLLSLRWSMPQKSTLQRTTNRDDP